MQIINIDNISTLKKIKCKRTRVIKNYIKTHVVILVIIQIE